MLIAFWERLPGVTCFEHTGGIRRPDVCQSTISLPIMYLGCWEGTASELALASGMRLAAMAALVRCCTPKATCACPPLLPLLVSLAVGCGCERGLSWHGSGVSAKSCRRWLRRGSGCEVSMCSLLFTSLGSFAKAVFLPLEGLKFSLLLITGGPGLALSPPARSQLSEFSVMRPLCCRRSREEKLDEGIVPSTATAALSRWPSRSPRGDE
mmetsp:Transcript_115482/g.337788  ORF Transcript_115482/g.337788 Transcript_115482/m.337788 type:complete len:210 (+) Transcript_115482:432-1061(+)